MDFLANIIDILLNVDKHLNSIITDYRVWTYLILFIVIFAETGFVVTPFLPGDALLFATGALIAGGGTGLDINIMAVLLFIAAVTGNMVNYNFGSYFGPKVFKPDNKILKLKYYHSTEAFFAKHGGKSVIFSRFFPIFRTFVPFVAGVIKMPWKPFMLYNIYGAGLWIISFVYGGFLFGNIPIIKDNFGVVVLIVSLGTAMPPIIAALYNKFGKKKEAQ